MPSAAVFGCEATRLSPTERAFFADADPWGFILFSRNIDNPDQVAALVDEFRSAVGHQAAVLIDQEGGRVARLRRPFWQEWDPPGSVGGVSESDEAACAAVRSRYRRIAQELASLGIDVNCAPVLDLPRDGDAGVIGDRAFGRSPETVAARGRAACAAHLEEGVLPVLKHIPGHGSASADSHIVLPVSDIPAEELEVWDYAPFRALAGMPAAMTAHVAYSALDPGVPATQSRTVIEEAIRGSIGFDGLLFSDDICMDALRGGPAERAACSLSAGCDLVLHCSGDLDEMRAAMEVIPPLEGASARRAAATDAIRLRSGADPGR